MRETRPGEEPSGLAERMFQQTGHKKWKMEPADIELLRQALDEALDQRAQEWLDAWPNKPGPPKP